MRSRGWCFTVNNYTDEDQEILQDIECKYIVYGREIGEEEKTPHLQGYIYWANALRFDTVKARLPRGAHLEPAKGDSLSNRNYCTKQGDFEEKGDRPMSSREKGEEEILRWDNARLAAMDGRIEDVPADIFVRHYSNIKRIARDFMSKADDLPEVCGTWIMGPPGTGKSFSARRDYPNAYLKMQNKWWDGYQNEENIIIDDFDCKTLGHHLKIWADRYAFLAEIKGSAIQIRPKNIVVTSNYTINQIFGDDEVLVAALERRFKVIKMLTVFVRQ